jgi:hypothetical protein
MKAGIEGSAVLTATAEGFLSSTAKASASVFGDFALRLVPLDNPVTPGDLLHLRVGLLAAGEPFETPVGLQVSITASLQGTSLQTVGIQPGSSDAYVTILVPSGASLQTTPFVTVTAAAPGFTSDTATVGLSPHGANPQEALIGPERVNLTAGSDEFLSVSLFNGTFAPASGSLTLDLFSSNSSVVQPQVTQVTLSGSDSATFPVHANATGTTQITAVAPGLTSIPLTVTVVAPFKPSLGISIPPKVRAGEQYSYAVGFYYRGEPVPYGPVAVHVSSSNLNLTVPTSIEATALGYGVGTLAAGGVGAADITAVMEGATDVTATVTSVYSPVVAPVTYAVTTLSYSGPLVGVPVSFTYHGRISITATGSSGSSEFAASNDTVTVASVPSSLVMENARYYFTGWSNGVKTENVSLLASSPTLSITAQYFKSVVPTNYSLLALADEQKPVAGPHFNVYSPALKENL